MKIFGKYKSTGKKTLVAVGDRADKIATDIGKSGPISRKLLEGFDVLWWEDDNGRRSQHLEEA